MKALLISFILLLFFEPFLTAQNLSSTHYKYRTTLRVCKQVALSFNDLRQIPTLVMPKGKSNQIARFSLEPEIQLIIDEKLYDLCREIGKDSLSALAFIISHELTHFFYNHRHPFGFATPQSQLNESNPELEKQADLYGLINAFSAGYQSFKVAKPILAKIYRAYQLPDIMEGYGTKTERLKSIELSTKQAQELASTFEVGKFLYLKGEYKAAEHCFAHISSSIPAKEFLNNLGLTQLQQVLNSKWIKVQFMPFKLPVELEAENRLLGGNRQGEDEKNNELEGLLEESIKNFEKAISLDKEYIAACINLVTAQLLLNQYGTAKDMLGRLKKNTKALRPDAYLLSAITHLHFKEYEASQADLDRADGAFEIAYNRKIASLLQKGETEKDIKEWVEKYTLRPSVVVRSLPVSVEKNIGDISLPLSGQLPINYKRNLPQPNLVHFQYSVLDGLHAYKILLKDGTFHVIQNFSPIADLPTKQGIKFGDTVEMMKNKYGNPSRIVAIDNGYFYCYDQAQIYFKVSQNVIESWLIYQKNGYR